MALFLDTTHDLMGVKKGIEVACQVVVGKGIWSSFCFFLGSVAVVTTLPYTLSAFCPATSSVAVCLFRRVDMVLPAAQICSRTHRPSTALHACQKRREGGVADS
ncbi:hypothetical protein AC579_7658 [Pseudocercospora musae]|uniref:Uncharacterized protein n=1 Tax=Pseudocercospora musae TaxID=113226 RepID=A0A139I4E9_9PEZI|nr:hypothetical protein AC579_7658 [Pseudocercospora musae]